MRASGAEKSGLLKNNQKTGTERNKQSGELPEGHTAFPAPNYESSEKIMRSVQEYGLSEALICLQAR